MHRSPSNKVYIGITKQKPKCRWRHGEGYKRSTYFYNAIKKYGWESFEHIILFTQLTKQKAEDKEIALIGLFESNNSEYGYNIRSGGDAGIGMSEEGRESLRSIKLGKPRSAEVREKISRTRKERYKQYELWNARPVLQIDTTTLEIIGRYKSASEASKVTGIDNSCIGKVCKGVSRTTAGGYGWEYEDKYNYLEGEV